MLQSEFVRKQTSIEQRIDALPRPEISLDIISTYLALPGLRGFWPMSSFNENGNAYDMSEQGRILTYNGNPTYNYINLVPYLALDGTGDYLTRTDEAGLDIIGNETYVATAVQGITMYIWCWFDNAAAALEYVFSKWTGADNAYRLIRNAAGDADFSITDGGAVLRTVTIADALDDNNEWHFVAGRLDRSGNTVDVYVGNDDGFATNSLVVPVATTINNSASDLRIGAQGSVIPFFLMTGRVSLAALCVMGHSEALIQSVFAATRAAFRV